MATDLVQSVPSIIKLEAERSAPPVLKLTFDSLPLVNGQLVCAMHTMLFDLNVMIQSVELEQTGAS